MVSVLCESSKKEILTEMIYTETSTLGVRIKEVERVCLPREIVKVATEHGEIDVKVAEYKGSTINVKPEYEQIREIALKSNKSFKEIESEILKKYNER
jgi:pyridinium-3,5-bisthiocarboxylic acid mononucleotide nickel chelatase